MSDEDISSGLATAFQKASIVGEVAMDPEVRLDHIEGLDSVSRVRLMMCVEEQFAIRITPRENSKARTIGDLMTLVRSKRGSR